MKTNLLTELQAAHQIIRNGLNIMTTQQKSKWGELNAKSGVEGEGVTRANEREAVIQEALSVAACDQPKAPSLALEKFITVPEVTLPNGTVLPSFQVSQTLCSRDPDGTPWVDINYHDARKACEQAGAHLITESQALAIAHDIASQDINWTGGKVGEGQVYQGLHKGTVSEAQGPAYESNDPEERRWHQLSNGQRIVDFAGNAYTWVFDDVQGDEAGIVAKAFAEDSPSITTAPFPSMEKGVGWLPDAGDDWSGSVLFRGGCWRSGCYAGVFRLDRDCTGGEWPAFGFRCTK